MQPGGGSHFPPMGGTGSATATSADDDASQMVVEEATPISSRPPAATAAANLDEFMPPPGTSDMDALAAAAAAGEDADRGGGGGFGLGGSSGGGGNRWPRQETLALLRIRSEMDSAFRDATVKGPLWEDVSRKLAELGYKRSAKKCKEKFENVDKYYKRTKEGRAGRQDGKTYKFFSELEALHNTSTTLQIMPPPAMAGGTTANFPPGMGFSSPTPISSIRPHQPSTSILPGSQSHAFPASIAPAFLASPIGLDFSSNSSSSSHETEDGEDIEGSDPEAQPSNLGGSSRKRKRGDGRSRGRMMVFFDGLLKQVMQKQEAMQQRFLEAIEKREHDRLIREEAWRRQEMARLSQKHEIMARERAVSASRDASIMAFLQKITGQTIQLPSVTAAAAATPISITPTTPAAAIPHPIHMPVPSQQPLSSYHPPQQKSQQLSSDCPLQVHPVNVEAAAGHQSPVISRDIVLAAVPEQQVRPQDAGGGSGEPPSSRWPKAEVLELIKLRSGLESRYQEAGPKGPLWEEISAGMHRMGYRRNPKRCKEKWENINKYFKKVKESNKKRLEDAKTCPYFHELDALYRNKFIGGSNRVSIGVNIEGASTGQQKPIDAADTSQQESRPTSQTFESETKEGGKFNQAAENIDAADKPEDTVKDQSQGRNEGCQQHNLDQLLTSLAEQGRNDGQHEAEEEDDVVDEEYDDEDEDEEELEEDERKTAYKIDQLQAARDQSKRQQQNAAAVAAGAPKAKANGGGSSAATTTASFMAMVQ